MIRANGLPFCVRIPSGSIVFSDQKAGICRQSGRKESEGGPEKQVAQKGSFLKFGELGMQNTQSAIFQLEYGAFLRWNINLCTEEMWL